VTNEGERAEQPGPPASTASTPTYPKGDLLHPEWSERAPWFGYIGVGIALAAMLLGIAGMAMAVMYLWRWTGS